MYWTTSVTSTSGNVMISELDGSNSQVIVTSIPRRGMYSGNEMKAGMSSLLINAAVVALLLMLSDD